MIEMATTMLLVLLFHLLYASTDPSVEGASKITEESVHFLEQYGYLEAVNPHSGQLRTQNSVSEALKKFQVFAGLKATGKLDRDTLTKIREPRCGMQDFLNSKKQKWKPIHSLEKRFAVQGSYWKKKKLTYRIMNYSYRLSPFAVRATIRNVLDKWQQVSNLEFKETLSEHADILVRFVRGFHNDQYSFDGKGGTLAHAFYPHDNTGLAGDAHFDDDEEFTLGTSRGTNFYWVALHELGHSIGLEHSDVQGAIMYPWYQGYKGDDAKLTYDDIVGIQSIYGVPDRRKYTYEPSTTTVEVTSPDVDIHKNTCVDRVNAVFLRNDGRTYVVKKDKLYVLGKYLTFAEGPLELYKYFPGIDRIDTAYVRKDGRIVLFHGKRFWIFDGRKRIQGPDNISTMGLTRNMYNLDAAFFWSRNSKVYFFKQRWYWRYDPVRRRIDPGYPRLIASWRGIPTGIDSAFEWSNKKLYFFKGKKFYRFNERIGKVQDGYPRQIAGDFVVCPKRIGKQVLPSTSAKVQVSCFLHIIVWFMIMETF